MHYRTPVCFIIAGQRSSTGRSLLPRCRRGRAAELIAAVPAAAPGVLGAGVTGAPELDGHGMTMSSHLLSLSLRPSRGSDGRQRSRSSHRSVLPPTPGPSTKLLQPDAREVAVPPEGRAPLGPTGDISGRTRGFVAS
jgi:hypothetical protein